MMNLKNSQNFLNDKNLVEYLVRNSSINSDDTVLEIGPGKGIITNMLANYAERVIAVEYDKMLFDALVEKNKKENVEYIFNDILKIKLPSYKYKVFSNIPFQITADIIKKLTENSNCPEDIYLIVQKEAAKKYCGIPFQKMEGLRASILKLKYKVSIVHCFKKTDFSPVPNVDIVLLHLVKRNDCMDEKSYLDCRDLISYMYNCSKGNTSKERLATLFTNPQIIRLARDNNINLNQSYTQITSEQWEKIYMYSKIGVSSEKRKLIVGKYNKNEKRNKGLKKQNRSNYRTPRKSNKTKH